MSTQTDIFRHLVSDRLGDPPVCISPDATLKELVGRMASETATSAVVIDEEWYPIGILTEQDVTRKIAFRLNPETPVSHIMTTPVVTIQRSDYLYHAVAFMRRRELRHIPVLNEEGLVCGMLSLSEALGFLSQRTVVTLGEPLPIHIIYSTAWLAEDGTIRFYVDFYQRDEKLYQALFGKPLPWRGG